MIDDAEPARFSAFACTNTSCSRAAKHRARRPTRAGVQQRGRRARQAAQARREQGEGGAIPQDVCRTYDSTDESYEWWLEHGDVGYDERGAQGCAGRRKVRLTKQANKHCLNTL